MSLHDIAVYSRDDRQVLVVEIRSSIASEPEQLERVRQALMDDTASQSAQFLLLAQRNGLFLWKGSAVRGAKAEVASVKSVLRDYAESVPDREETLRKPGLEIIIYSWFDDLAFGIRKPKPESEADQLLVTAGVYDLIRSGRVVMEHVQ